MVGTTASAASAHNKILPLNTMETMAFSKKNNIINKEGFRFVQMHLK
jgi:hypothetical protein